MTTKVSAREPQVFFLWQIRIICRKFCFSDKFELFISKQIFKVKKSLAPLGIKYNFRSETSYFLTENINTTHWNVQYWDISYIYGILKLIWYCNSKYKNFVNL